MDFTTKESSYCSMLLPLVSGHDRNEATIDLGLSLGTYPQKEAYEPQQRYSKLAQSHPSGSCERTSSIHQKQKIANRRQGSGYVKVNMEGVIIGRKICVSDCAGYSSLAVKLESMFGKYCASGLQLMDEDSPFSLVYRGRNGGDWKPVGDISWREFQEHAMRLRISWRSRRPDLMQRQRDSSC